MCPFRKEILVCFHPYSGTAWTGGTKNVYISAASCTCISSFLLTTTSFLHASIFPILTKPESTHDASEMALVQSNHVPGKGKEDLLVYSRLDGGSG